MTDLTTLTLADTQKYISEKKASASEIAAAYSARTDALEEKVHSFAAREETPPTGEGALTGCPVAVKDVFLITGKRTTGASAMLKDYHATYTSTAAARMLAAGASCPGTLNTDEFTMGSSTETSAHGVTKNPWDATKVPGGSSGGSAAAVAARFCVAALGTDTGGSIRQPASFCGVTGFKPGYGRISRYGVMSMASSLDTVGVLTKTVEDAAILTAIMAGPDGHDATCIDEPAPCFHSNLTRNIDGLTIGLPKEYFTDSLNPQVQSVIEEAIEVYKKNGAQVKEISLPTTGHALAVYYLIAPSEISANMARYDGIRFGPSTTDASDIVDMYVQNRTAGFGMEVKRRIMLGTFALSAGYADAYYTKAQKVRTLIVRDFAEAFKEVDIIAAPTAPTTAFAFGSKEDPLSMYLSDIFTIPASLAGLPTLSVPAGFSQGLPVGLQLYICTKKRAAASKRRSRLSGAYQLAYSVCTAIMGFYGKVEQVTPLCGPYFQVDVLLDEYAPTIFPGDFLTVAVPAVGEARATARAYSVASVSGKKVSFLIGLVRYTSEDGQVVYGRGSSYLKKVAVGEQLHILARGSTFPWGVAPTGPWLMIAAGTGLAPLFAVAEGLSKKQDRQPIELFFGVRKNEWVFWEEKLKTLCDTHGHMRYHICISDETPVDGRTSGFAASAALHTTLSGKYYGYASGSTMAVKAAEESFVTLGLTKERYFLEGFG